MEIQNKLKALESSVVEFFNKINLPLSRFAIFLVYFWFGILKVLELSPASPLVINLLKLTLPFFPPSEFLIFFGLFEMLIGVLFLFPRFTRIALLLLFGHILTTILPLFVMPDFTWSGFMVPTLEGQYIIKNILVISAAVNIGSKLKKTL